MSLCRLVAVVLVCMATTASCAEVNFDNKETQSAHAPTVFGVQEHQTGRRVRSDGGDSSSSSSSASISIESREYHPRVGGQHGSQDQEGRTSLGRSVTLQQQLNKLVYDMATLNDNNKDLARRVGKLESLNGIN